MTDREEWAVLGIGLTGMVFLMWGIAEIGCALVGL